MIIILLMSKYTINSPCILIYLFNSWKLWPLRRYSNEGTQGLRFGRKSFDFTTHTIKQKQEKSENSLTFMKQGVAFMKYIVFFWVCTLPLSLGSLTWHRHHQTNKYWLFGFENLFSTSNYNGDWVLVTFDNQEMSSFFHHQQAIFISSAKVFTRANFKFNFSSLPGT